MPRILVLVVHDDNAARQAIMLRLSAVQVDCEAYAFADSEDAIGWIREHGPVKLAIANIGNPRSQHSNAADIIERCPGVGVVVVTGQDLDDEIRAQHANALAIISAPLPDNFCKTIERLLTAPAPVAD